MSSVSRLHDLRRLLQPSFSSAVLTAVTSLAIVLSILTPSLYEGSDFALYFDSLKNQKNSLTENYEIVSLAVNQSDFAANAAVFVVWMVIGLLAYAIVLSLVKFIISIVRFVREVEYFKAERERIAFEALEHLATRSIAVVGLFGLYKLIFPFGISYIFVFAHRALTGSAIMGVWYVLLMSLVIAACVHVMVILIRMTLLRVRVFYDRHAISEA